MSGKSSCVHNQPNGGVFAPRSGIHFVRTILENLGLKGAAIADPLCKMQGVNVSVSPLATEILTTILTTTEWV